MDLGLPSSRLSRNNTIEKIVEPSGVSNSLSPEKSTLKDPTKAARLDKKDSMLLNSNRKIPASQVVTKTPHQNSRLSEKSKKKPEDNQKADEQQGGYEYFDEYDYREKSEIDLLYLPLEKSIMNQTPTTSRAFTRFNDLKKSEGYIRRKNKLTEQSSVINTMCKRLLYNNSQRENYLSQVSHNSSAMLSKVIEKSEKWEKQKVDHMKILKRNPFSQMDDIGSIVDPTVQQKTNNQSQLSVFVTDDERKNHIKTFKLAWYPPSEPTYKNIESLEGSTATLVGKKAYVLGGFRNSSNNAFFSYDVGNDKFEILETKGFAPQCIVYHTAVAFNKDVYIFGGDSGLAIANSKVVTNELLKLDTQTLEWTKLKPLKAVEPRKHHAACEFGDYMLISGGMTEDSNIPYKDFHAYHPESNEWFKIQDQVDWSGLSHHTMTPVYCSKVKSLYSKNSGGNKNKIDANDVRKVHEAYE